MINKLILHLESGSATVSYVFCKLMYEYDTKFNVFIQENAFSSGKLITFSANRIYLNKYLKMVINKLFHQI